MGSGPTGIADRFSRQDYRGGGDERAVGKRATALRHRSFITPLFVIERKTRRARQNRKRGGKEKRRESGMEATWLPTAIRGGGRHESHDDVTATIATSRRGQYVSLPKPPCRSLGSFLAASSTLHRVHEYRQRDDAQSARGEEREKGRNGGSGVVRGEGL